MMYLIQFASHVSVCSALGFDGSHHVHRSKPEWILQLLVLDWSKRTSPVTTFRTNPV